MASNQLSAPLQPGMPQGQPISQPQPGGYGAAPVAAPGQRDMGVKSLYEHRYAQADIHEHTFWLCVNPCMCGGIGLASPVDPIKSTVAKFLCLEGYAWTEDINDKGLGCCFEFNKTCCCISHGACPPGGGAADGVPCFACCNQRFGGEAEGQQPHRQIVADLMRDSFLLYYCGCFGFGIGRLGDPCFMSSNKFLCIRTESFSADCVVKDLPPCFNHDKCCCLVSAYSIPCFGGAADGLPGCACCGQTLACPPLCRDGLAHAH